LGKLFSKSLIILILSIVFISGTTDAKEKLTPYSITFGAGINANIYNASFSSIPGFKTCCPEYTNALGIGYNFFAGFSYRFDTKLFGMPWNYTANVSYNNLGAAFSDEEFIGNIITNNTYVKGISEYYLEASLSTIAVDQFITFNPLESIPLGVNAGFSVGFLNGKSFSQEERLKTPANSTFENGTNKRNKFTGDITGASSALLIFRLGLCYDLIKSGNYTFSPFINFNYAFTNVAESLDWKAHSLAMGLTVAYNIPKTEYEIPKPVPQPKLPLPPMLVPVSLSMVVYTGDSILANGGTIDIKHLLTREVYSYQVQPVVFFSKNSEVPLANINNAARITSIQAEPLQGIFRFMKNNPGISITITAYQTDDENQNTAEERLSFIKKKLSGSGIDIGKINFMAQTKRIKDLPNPEIADEYRNVHFEFAGFDKTINIKETKGIAGEKFESETLKITPNIDNNPDNVNFTGKIYYGDQETNLEANRENKVNLENKFNFNTSKKQLYIQAMADNASGEKDIEYQTVYLDFHDFEGDTIQNRFKNGDQSYYENFLGYFDYNRSDFMTYDRDVINRVKLALNAGKKVEFLPLTDNLGSEEHNTRLANSRLNSAYNLVGTKSGITPVFPENYIFPNEHPSGRILNRSVIVRIYE
jgi:hypothetical protein